MKKITTLIALILLVSAQGQTNSDYSDLKKEIDTYFKKRYTSDTGGMAVAVVKNGEVVFENAYGMANLEYQIPNTVNTVFHAASLSKQFTAYAILLLEQEGKIALEDDIRKYIPEVPDFGKKITLHHLASHTSGLRDQWRLLHMAGWRPDDVILNEDIFKLVSQQKDLNFDPGSKLMYSNTGFTLLAEVVARVSGKTFAEFTKARIFEPLQMTNTLFYDDYEKVVPNRAYSYKNENDVVKKSKLSFSTVGATSLFTTVKDLSKWAIHLNGLPKENKELAERMNTPARLNNGETTEAAMGQWTGVKLKGMEWFDHSGSDASFRAYFSRFPENNSAVVLLGNTTPLDASGLALGVADPFLREFYKEEVGEGETSGEDKKPQQTYDYIKLPKKELSKFLGKYRELEEQYDREIKLINDTLVYYRRESSQTKLLPVSNNEFKMLNDPNDASVFFETDEQNNPIMRLNINNERTVFFSKYNTDFLVKEYVGDYYSPELDTNISIQIQGELLNAVLFKQNSVELNPIKKDFFKSSNRNLKKIEFLRDKSGKLSGLLISNGGAVNVHYVKRE